MASWASDAIRSQVCEAVAKGRRVLAATILSKETSPAFARDLSRSLAEDIARVKAGEQLEIGET